MITVDVLVVGGGPTGLTVAGDLARAGRSVAVLERRPTPNPASRAFATMARTLEVLDARGLADGLIAGGTTAAGVNLFAGARIDLTRLHSRYPFVLVTPQTKVDQALAGYAEAQGAAIHRGWAVTALEQDATGVTVTARRWDGGKMEDAERGGVVGGGGRRGDGGKMEDAERGGVVGGGGRRGDGGKMGDAERGGVVGGGGRRGDGGEQTWRAAYVVGADGAHSTVRELVGADFPGRAVLSSVVLADVKLSQGPVGGLTLGSTRTEFGFLAPYGRTDDDGGSWFRSMTWDRRHQLPDTAPATRDEVVGVLRRAMGRDVGVVDVGWLSRFHSEERQTSAYRHGRVLLAGDAAHVHSPMGGQGMNTGIQDAANLAWKLDAVLGGAGDDVLDTYHAERHPIGRRVLRQSGLMLRGVTLYPRPARFLRDRIAPRLLRNPAVGGAVSGSFAGTTLGYGHGAVRATEVPLAEGRLTVVQRTPGFVLVRGRDDREVADAGVLQARRTDDGPALLVRPDGYVAWTGPVTDDGWRTTLAGWTTRRIHAPS